MDMNAFAQLVGGEMVGGRVLAVVDGKKVYLSDTDDSGASFLNEVGIRLRDTVDEGSSKPRGRPRKPRPDDVDVEE